MALHELKYELEQQLYFLYIVQASNDILLSKANTLLEEIPAFMHKYVTEIDELMLQKVLKRVVDDDKRSNLMYICFTLRICRSYPAVSDHIADLLGEILKLPNTKFLTITMLFQEILEVKFGFFRTIMSDGTLFQLGMQLKRIVGWPLKLRKTMSIIREVLDNKLKFFKSKGDTIKLRTKAVRLLIDMFDKAFEGLGNEAISIEFSNLKNALKGWSAGETDNMKKSFMEFCNYIFDILTFDWNRDTKEEVIILIEILVTGSTTENSNLSDDLLYKGSNYIINGFFVSDMDPI